MAQHEIDPDRLPYAPESLERKPDMGAEGFFAVDMRAGRVTGVEPFPEARKPAWKLTVDFGPVVGTLRTSAQITNYRADELRGGSSSAPSTWAASGSRASPASSSMLGALDPDGTVRLLELPDGVGAGAPIVRTGPERWPMSARAP